MHAVLQDPPRRQSQAAIFPKKKNIHQVRFLDKILLTTDLQTLHLLAKSHRAPFLNNSHKRPQCAVQKPLKLNRVYCYSRSHAKVKKFRTVGKKIIRVNEDSWRDIPAKTVNLYSTTTDVLYAILRTRTFHHIQPTEIMNIISGDGRK